MRKRSHLDIVFDILRYIQEKGENVKPTHILYKSNLSSQMLKDYLKELLDKHFIKENNTKKGKTYSLTEKGFNFIKDYKVIKSFTISYGLE